MLIGNRFQALRDVGPEFEAGSCDLHSYMLPDGALRVKLLQICGSAVSWDENTSLTSGGKARSPRRARRRLTREGEMVSIRMNLKI